MNASTVAYANRNAEINGIKNCRFVCSKAEGVTGSLLKEYLTKKLDSGINDSDVGIKGDEKKDIKEVIKEEENNSINENNNNNNNNEKKMEYFENVVAVVDPPRVGLHPTVIKALRTHSRLRRLVYISFNPKSLMANAIELCTPSDESNEKGNKNNRGWRNMSSAGLARHKSMPTSEPFKPVKAMVVDLFPHTPYCELVMLLERYCLLGKILKSAAKSNYISAGQINVPIVFRGPNGLVAGVGAQHSHVSTGSEAEGHRFPITFTGYEEGDKIWFHRPPPLNLPTTSSYQKSWSYHRFTDRRRRLRYLLGS
ncbi:unnamed protein product [Lactuca virosa]|uniref:Pyruvate dehydrogenase E1 component subunit beta n=1 Tax=Lactuca virosa TaxID=75947 RepID=A0AAU9MGG5_9ASTR|nr:unnamed protein product [Lactuca virosa]